MKLVKLALFLTLAVASNAPITSRAYSILTHEAIIDASWDRSIRPVLLSKFPGSTPDQLKEAHAYAYGGCVAPDMGYYPYGSKLFTDLVHYVRTGDLVNNMLKDARDLNEYAFALGFLCHYNADKYGHPIAVNRCVPLLYPADKKLGNHVTYEQDPTAHVRTEFSFDVLQTARGNYAPEAYHDFIGFKVSQSLLERSFRETYGIEINSIFKDLSRSIESFRWIIKNLFPTLTKAAWVAKKNEIRKTHPSLTRRRFEYRMKRASYNREYGRKHDKPGVTESILGITIKVLPKIGPLKELKMKMPDSTAEAFFLQSFDSVLEHYTLCLRRIQNGCTDCLPNIDFDTGNNTFPGEYGMADKCYTTLLLRLNADDFRSTDRDLQHNILTFYSTCSEKLAARIGFEQWQHADTALGNLRRIAVN